jgi:hypothetical protein
MELTGKTEMLCAYASVCDFFQQLQVSLLGKHIPGLASETSFGSGTWLVSCAVATPDVTAYISRHTYTK